MEKKEIKEKNSNLALSTVKDEKEITHMENDKAEECFIIMPISDQDGYETNHFSKVYSQIIKPAVERAGYICKRADDEVNTHMIPLTIIQNLIEAPMAICDLSSKNPNVMFELGIRQAFNMPVVLIQDDKTPRIFDVGTLNTLTYQSNREYESVLLSHDKIVDAINGNCKRSDSLISLLKLVPAKFEISAPKSNDDKIDLLLGIVYDLNLKITSYDSKYKNINDVSNRNDRIPYLISKAKERLMILNKKLYADTQNYSTTRFNILYEEIISSLDECQELEVMLQESINNLKFSIYSSVSNNWPDRLDNIKNSSNS